MRIANNKAYTYSHGMKISLYLAFTVLFVFCLSWKSGAQNHGLRFEKIGVEQGLSDETVISILQDSKGYIWFGTLNGGLNKYDGYSFTKYQFDPYDSNSISQNFIYTIYEDSAGAIWVSTFEGLCRFDRHTEKFTRYKPSLNAKFSDPNITAINEDADGMLWLGNTWGGLCRFDRQKGTFLPEYYDLGNPQVPGGGLDAINCISKDRSGTLWVGNGTGLHKMTLIRKRGQLSKVSFQHYRHDPKNSNSLGSNKVRSVFEDKAGIMWLATDNGLNSFDRKTGVFKRYQHDSKNIHSISSNNLNFWVGNSIKEDKEGNLWIPTDNGLNKLNEDRSIFMVYLNKPNDVNSISTDVVYSLEIDREGILWAGGWNQKLNKANLNHKPFNVIRHDPNNNNSLSDNLVTCTLEDAAGIVWIGTVNGGLNRWDKKTAQFKRFRHDAANPKTLRSNTVNAIIEDRHGCLWVCNGDVLSKMNTENGAFKHYYTNNEKKGWPPILSIAENRDGHLWLGLGTSLKSFDEKTGKFKSFYYDPRDTNGMSDGTSISVFCDSKDHIWVGHGSRATDRFDKETGRFTHFKYDPLNSASISSNIVNNFKEDSHGNIWLGTSAGGLCYFDYQKRTFTTFTDKHGLADNTVFSILEDNNQQLWLGTKNGLSKFDPVSKTFTNYDYKDGLAGNIFGTGDRARAAHLKGKDGTLYFGGPNGLVYFDPAQLTANSHIAPIVITQFKLFDKLVKGSNESNEIILDYNQNYFSFEFSSLSFYNPAKNKYAYKLEGVDKDWVYSGSRRYVGYTNIDPGKYTFRVNGTNNDGIWNEKGASITVIIKPPWWRTWWAYILYAMAFAGLIYMFIQRRLNKIRMQHEIVVQKHKAAELEMQALRAQMNPHFIFNCLNSINHFILNNETEAASDYLTKFSRLIRTVLQLSRESEITLQEELDCLNLYIQLEQLRFQKLFQYTIHADENLDLETIRIPPMLLQPFVENAIKHGLTHKDATGYIEVHLYRLDTTLYCKITDNGIGRKNATASEPSKHLSMGIRITADRIALLQQNKEPDTTIQITDLVLPDGTAGGTEVLLKIPVYQAF
jgi:ligand-binding sensor domain-containing protein